MRLFVIFARVLLGLTGTVVADQPDQTTSYYYYIDGRKVALWLCEDMVASFPNVPAALSQSGYDLLTNPHQMRAAAADHFSILESFSSPGVVGLYRIGERVRIERGNAAENNVDVHANNYVRRAGYGGWYRYSEVFSTVPVPGKEDANFYALPGGVFVKFAADWSYRRILQWLAEQGVASHRVEQVLKNNVYLVHTAHGMAALALANRLQETNQVLYAEPNWWNPSHR